MTDEAHPYPGAGGPARPLAARGTSARPARCRSGPGQGPRPCWRTRPETGRPCSPGPPQDSRALTVPAGCDKRPGRLSSLPGRLAVQGGGGHSTHLRGHRPGTASRGRDGQRQSSLAARPHGRTAGCGHGQAHGRTASGSRSVACRAEVVIVRARWPGWREPCRAEIGASHNAPSNGPTSPGRMDGDAPSRMGHVKEAAGESTGCRRVGSNRDARGALAAPCRA
jgi:hypothetical protein